MREVRVLREKALIILRPHEQFFVSFSLIVFIRHDALLFKV